MKSVLWTLALSMFVFCFSAWAQPPDTLWSRVYSSSWMDQATGLDTTFDGGFIMCGTVYDGVSLPTDAIIRKLDSLGAVQWAWRFGNSTDSEEAEDIIQASDSTFVWVGEYMSGPDIGMYIVKCRDAGDSLWSRSVPTNGFTRVASVIETQDRGYLVTGDQRSQAPSGSETVVAKFTQTGENSWMHSYSRGSGFRFDVRDMIALSDGGFAFVCEIRILFQPLPTILSAVRCDSAGDTLWTREYEHPNGSLHPINMCTTEDGGFLISCDLEADHYRSYLMCIDSIGDTLWSKICTNGTTGISSARIKSFDNGVYIHCGTASFLNGDQVSLLRLSANGDVIWTQHTMLAEYALSGLTCTPTRDGGYAVLAAAVPPAADTFFSALVRYEPDRVDAYPLRNSAVLHTDRISCFPNPFNSTTQIEFTLPSTQRVSLRLYDVLGREVAVLVNEIKTAGGHRVVFDAAGLASGVYLCRMEAGGMMQTRKLALIR